MVIIKVLRPSPGLTIAANEVQQCATYAWIKLRPVEVQGHGAISARRACKSRERSEEIVARAPAPPACSGRSPCG